MCGSPTLISNTGPCGTCSPLCRSGLPLPLASAHLSSASPSSRFTLSIVSCPLRAGLPAGTARAARGLSSFCGGSGGVSCRCLLTGTSAGGSGAAKLSPSGPNGPRSSSMTSAWATWRPGRRVLRRAAERVAVEGLVFWVVMVAAEVEEEAAVVVVAVAIGESGVVCVCVRAWLGGWGVEERRVDTNRGRALPWRGQRCYHGEDAKAGCECLQISRRPTGKLHRLRGRDWLAVGTCLSSWWGEWGIR